MKRFDELELVNYCHPDCEPLKNIMRLPKAEAFAMARQMAEAHPETTAFYRFSDFVNYYALREAQASFLHEQFIKLGGTPEEEHPLSFVIEGSDYLKAWFGDGNEVRITLGMIADEHISFTIGDSGALFRKNGTVELLTKPELKQRMEEAGGLEALLKAAGKQYVEVQLWSDRYVAQLVKRQMIEKR